MRRRGLIAWSAVALASGAWIAMQAAPHARAAVPGPGARRFPNVLLKTHTGRDVRFYDDVLAGDKIVLLNFMYARCNGICPGTTQNLLRVQHLLADRMGRDVFMYSITLTPENDTPA